MVLRRVLPFCFLTVLILPRISYGQSKDINQPGAIYSNSIVSVHELSIPGKARNAFDKGVQRLKVKDWAGSVAQFQRAIESFPAFYEAYDMLGAAELAMQHWNDAEAAFRKSIELSHGSYAPPHFGLGLILCISQKRYSDSEAVIREGLDVDPSNASGHFALAWVLYAAARFAESEQSAREAILYNPTFQEPYLLLGQIHCQQNNFAAEVDDLNRYLKLDSTSSRSERARSALAEAQRALSKENSGAIVLPLAKARAAGLR